MMRLVSLLVLLSWLACTSTIADVPADEVRALPGYGPVQTRQWSGYLNANEDGSTKFHYWFISSANNPKTDPVVLWLTGGPGCSSLYALLRENGPYKANGKRDGQGVPQMVDADYSWTSTASVLYLESPTGVGFSYNTNGSYALFNDDITSQSNVNAVLDFFKKFPEFAPNNFYIIGESYAGIYVPTLADRIRLLTSGAPNLQGIAIGNACWGNARGTCAFNINRNLEEYVKGRFYNFKFFEGHGWIDPMAASRANELCGNVTSLRTTPECISALRRMPDRVPSQAYNIYNIYDTCKSPLAASSDILMAPTPFGEEYLQALRLETQENRHKRVQQDDSLQYQPECVDIGFTADWLNTPSVQEALHVRESRARWSMCSSLVGGRYNRSIDSVVELYPTLIQHYRVLVYSGTEDACVPYIGSELWTRSLGYTPELNWRPWTVRNQQVAGYVIKYNANFSFATVKGAGHMVPEDMPELGHALFVRFISHENL